MCKYNRSALAACQETSRCPAAPPRPVRCTDGGRGHRRARAQVSTKFDMRSDENVIRNYGRMLVDLAAAIPDGIVCFFVSYSYMDSIVSRWNDMGVLKARAARPARLPDRRLAPSLWWPARSAPPPLYPSSSQ